jgi:hypothetical protein
VPSVKEQILGVAEGEEEKVAAGNSAQEAVKEATQKGEEVEFVNPEEEADPQMRRMKLDTLDEVELELERLSQEFLEKPKKPKTS